MSLIYIFLDGFFFHRPLLVLLFNLYFWGVFVFATGTDWTSDDDLASVEPSMDLGLILSKGFGAGLYSSSGSANLSVVPVFVSEVEFGSSEEDLLESPGP